MVDNEATQEMDATEQQIQEGYVEEPQEESVEEEYLSPREQKMQEIVALREKEELGEDVEIEASEDNSEEQEVVEEVISKPDDPVWEQDGKWYTKIKVDGEEVSVPFEDLKSSHQKDKASQKRFEDAAEYGRKIQAREEQLNAYVQELKKYESSKAKPPPRKEAEPQRDDEKLVKEYHDALYADDAAKAAELFKTLTNSGRREQPATQNVEEVVNKVLGKAMAQRQAEQERQQRWAYNKSLEDAILEFQDKYPDIAEVPELRAIADNQTVILMDENPNWTPSQTISAAAEYTRKWVSENTNNARDNTRVVRKQRIVKQPKAARATSIAPEEDSFPTAPADIIAEMKASRGQVL